MLIKPQRKMSLLYKSGLMAAVLALSTAAPALSDSLDFGLTPSFPFGQLDVDADATRAAGAGTPQNPVLVLASAPEENSGWVDVGVIATPETGVCAVFGGSGATEVEDDGLQEYVRTSFLARMSTLSEEVGTFIFSNEEGYDIEASLEKVIAEIRETGSVSYASSADLMSTVRLADFTVTYTDGEAETTYSMIYDNFPRCIDIIVNRS